VISEDARHVAIGERQPDRVLGQDVQRISRLGLWDLATGQQLSSISAETGDFQQAADWQQKAVESAPAVLRPEYRSRLELYQNGKPFRLPLRARTSRFGPVG
jgi:hypothetical protein